MAKLIISPGKALGEAAFTVKALYFTLVVAAIANLADSFLAGGLIGFYTNFTGVWAWVVAGLTSYLLYDVGNTIVRKRAIAKDISYFFSFIIAGLAGWNLYLGNMLAITPLVLAVLMVVFASTPATKAYLAPAQKPTAE